MQVETPPPSPDAPASGRRRAPGRGGVRRLDPGALARSPVTHDVLIAVGVAAVQVLAVVLANHFRESQPEAVPLDAFGAALPAVAGLSLLARRRYPVAVFGVTLAATAGYFALDYPRAPIFWAMIVAFVTTVLAGRRNVAIAELVVGYLTFQVAIYVGAGEGPNLGFALVLAAWLLALLTGAEALRARRERAQEHERTREEEARRRVTEERLRIARELHDVVAHNISLVNLQAGVALHLFDERPEQARTALVTIKEASKEALVELRSVLGVLRQVDEPDDVPRAPTPGLARLDDLVAQSRAAGVEVRVTRSGDEGRALAPGIDLAAFRIVQEALTNVARHAGPTTAEVRLTHRADGLDVEVLDDGAGPGGGPSPGSGLGSGHGVAGMRERAEAAGGTLEAGPRPGFGWRVHARLPYAPAGDDT
jgi:signal transduction histidine kinase